MSSRVLAWIAGTGLALGVIAAAPAGAAPPSQFDPIVEAQNFSITQQRQTTRRISRSVWGCRRSG